MTPESFQGQIIFSDQNYGSGCAHCYGAIIVIVHWEGIKRLILLENKSWLQLHKKFSLWITYGAKI